MTKMTNEQGVKVAQAIKWGMLRPLTNKKICMTGTLSVERKSLMTIINMLGGENHSSVTSSTDLLIVPNEEVRKGSKYRAAVAKGIQILSEEQFCDLILRSPEELLSYNS